VTLHPDGFTGKLWHVVDPKHRLALAFVLIAEMFRLLPGIGLFVPPAVAAVHDEERPKFANRDRVSTFNSKRTRPISRTKPSFS
jgi:hypothetical protein